MSKYVIYYINKNDESNWELEKAEVPFELVDKLKIEFKDEQITKEKIEDFLRRNEKNKKNDIR